MAAVLAVLGACSPSPRRDRSVQPPTTLPTVGTEWVARAGAPTARLEVASAAVGGLVYLAGGLVAGGVTAAVEFFDPDLNAWRRAPDLPIPLHHAMGAGYRGRFVVAGGFISAGSGAPSDRVFILRASGWGELPRLRRARGAAGSAVVDRRIYVVGGQDGRGLVAPTEVFDGKRWRDVAAIPTPRDHLGVTTDGRFVFAVGGRTRAIARTLSAFERYDPRTDRWATLPPLPTPRGGIGSGVLAGQLIVVGGEGPPEQAGADGVFEHVESFSFGARSWGRLPDMPTPRHGIGVGVVESTMVVAAGGARAGASYSSIVETLKVPRALLNP